MNYEKIVLVTRKTRLEGLVERFNTHAQAKFYIEHSGGDFALYEREHVTYHQALTSLKSELQNLTKLHVIEREFLPNYLFAKTDLVVTIGIDGLVVNTAKYLSGQPLVAVNPDPQHIDGILLPFDMHTVLPVLRKGLKEGFKVRKITMAEVRLNDGQTLLGFNDLFVGVRSHTSARYRITYKDMSEHHSSSGIIISTGAGSTGWLSSLFNMAHSLVTNFSSQPSAGVKVLRLPWDTDHLIYVVREPFVSKTSSARLVCGSITKDQPLVLESEMPEGGVIFSDGVEADYVAFNAGAIATVGIAEQQTRLVVG